MTTTLAQKQPVEGGDKSRSLVIPPPERCRPLDLATYGKAPLSIQYERHPAYRELVASAPLGRRVKALLVLTKYIALVVFKWLVQYEAIPAHLRRPRSAAAIGQLFVHVLRHAAWRTRSRPARADLTQGADILGHLRRQGCTVLSMPPGDLAAIARAAEPAFTELRRRRGLKNGGREFMESRTSVLRQDNSELFQSIDQCLRKVGVLDAISEYVGHPARVVDVNPQVNDSSDDFWRGIFPDQRIDFPQTAYLHRDASGGDIKLMIYLSDVGPKNGPFCFVLNSHKIKRARAREFIAEANDYCFCATDPRARSMFAGLPRILRRKCAFGNDIENSTQLSRDLLAAEWPMVGPRGTLVIFDPKGFHRGGMVEAGERAVITCVVG